MRPDAVYPYTVYLVLSFRRARLVHSMAARSRRQ